MKRHVLAGWFLISAVVSATAGCQSSGATAQIGAPSSLLQKCLGIVPGTYRMGPSPATERYCQQLPGASDYYQALGRFQAGDPAGAVPLLTKAAGMGNGLAAVRLALVYDRGEGVPRSAKAAFVWYQHGAAVGEPECLNQVGLSYELARGVPEDWDLAAKFYQASAAEGWMKGEFAYGRAFEFGIGVAQDRQQAIAWFQRSGEQGNAQGTYFARWLSDPTNNIGFRDNAEHDVVIAGKLRFGASLTGADPAGITFHNSAQRALWIMGLRQRVDRDEAEVFRQMRQREYDDCTRGGGDNCGFGKF